MASEQALLPELVLAGGGGSGACLATPVLRLRGEDRKQDAGEAAPYSSEFG